MDTESVSIRIGHDDYVVDFEPLYGRNCGCVIIPADSLDISLNGVDLELSTDQKRRTAFLLESMFNIKTNYTYSKMEESKIKTAVFLKDLADMMEKYYKVQIALVINPVSAKGELETRKFEDFMRDVAMDLALVKEEVEKS
jgi:hypothetical protein